MEQTAAAAHSGRSGWSSSLLTLRGTCSTCICAGLANLMLEMLPTLCLASFAHLRCYLRVGGQVRSILCGH